MARAKLGAMTEKWIDGKTSKSEGGKTDTTMPTKEKTKQTIYISKEAAKLLWHNRAETGETISRAVEKLVMRHLNREAGQGSQRQTAGGA